MDYFNNLISNLLKLRSAYLLKFARLIQKSVKVTIIRKLYFLLLSLLRLECIWVYDLSVI